MKTFALLALLAPWLLGPSAQAQAPLPQAVIPPPFVQGSLHGPEVDLFLAALEAGFTDAGWDVLSATDTAALGVAAPGPCSNNRCALAYARAAGADHALQLSLFLAQDQTISFTLALVQAPNHAFVYSAEDVNPVVSGPIFARAAEELTRQYRRGPGPWLEVRGEPLDAAVLLDGNVLGTLPLTRTIPGGEHVLIVRAEGYDDFNTTLWVDGFAGNVEKVEVTLQPTAATPASPEPALRTKRMRTFDWVGVGALAAAGTATLVGGLSIRNQACISHAEGACAEYRPKWGGPAKALVGVGAALLAGSVGWGLARSFAPYADRHAAGLTYRKDF